MSESGNRSSISASLEIRAPYLSRSQVFWSGFLLPWSGVNYFWSGSPPSWSGCDSFASYVTTFLSGSLLSWSGYNSFASGVFNFSNSFLLILGYSSYVLENQNHQSNWWFALRVKRWGTGPCLKTH